MIAFIIACVFTLLLLGLFVSSYYAYRRTFYSTATNKSVGIYKNMDEARENYQNTIARLLEMQKTYDQEDVYITSYDNLVLHAKYFCVQQDAPIHIMMHGYKSTADRDMCGLLKIMRDLGHNVLLVDQRGCGNSGGRTVTFGIEERYDALSWIKYLNARFNNPQIFLCGVSLGGSSVLMASELDLPENVIGIISDCAFSSPKGIIKKVCSDNGLPGFVIPLIMLGAILYGHFKVGGKGAYLSVRHARIPILIIHGKQDGFVPYTMAEEIFANIASEKYICTIDSNVHAGCHTSEPEKYKATVEEFVQKCVKNRPCVDKI